MVWNVKTDAKPVTTMETQGFANFIVLQLDIVFWILHRTQCYMAQQTVQIVEYREKVKSIILSEQKIIL